jgi:dynein heavy chain
VHCVAPFWVFKLSSTSGCVVAGAGVGKTQLVNGKLASLSEDTMSLSISFNYFTDVASFQKVGQNAVTECPPCSQLACMLPCWPCVVRLTLCCWGDICIRQVLEAPLEKKAGINYGPPGTKHLVYFVDDLNMPKLDPYETAMPISLIRQHLSWGHWFGEWHCPWADHIIMPLTLPQAIAYVLHRNNSLCCCADRAKLTPKNINNTQYVACMNPTAGSFVVNPRLQRLFMTLAVDFPGQDSLMTIYGTFIQVCCGCGR